MPKDIDLPNIYITMGEFHVSSEPVELKTVLGSCISACVRDPQTGIGGMNHFLLPGNVGKQYECSQYGAFAMELLINNILERGALKKRLEVKVFGGSNVIKSSMRIGDKNAQFVREYFHDEGLNIVTEDLGGVFPRKIRYFPHSGKVLLKRIESNKELEHVNTEEKTYKDVVIKSDKTKEELEFF